MYTLAREWALAGNDDTSGVVTLTLIGHAYAHRLACGDQVAKEALDVFGRLYAPEVAAFLHEHYWLRAEQGGGLRVPRPSFKRLAGTTKMGLGTHITWLYLVAAWAELYLASRGHTRPVGANSLEHVFWTHLPAMFASTLAQAQFPETPFFHVVGAGVAGQWPACLRQLAETGASQYHVAVPGGESVELVFDIHELMEQRLPNGTYLSESSKLRMCLAPREAPLFVPIVSSHMAVRAIDREMRVHPEDSIDGIVHEDKDISAGHNPKERRNDRPRLAELNDLLATSRERDIPLILAGGYAHPEQYAWAMEFGATCVQVGSAAVLCEGSGMRLSLREKLFAGCKDGTLRVVTLPAASPTGYPFTVAVLDDTLADEILLSQWVKRCDIGFLQMPVWFEGKLVTRCPAEEIERYLSVGGNLALIQGIMCLCRALSSMGGLASVIDLTRADLPIVPFGKEAPAQIQAWICAHQLSAVRECTAKGLLAFMDGA